MPIFNLGDGTDAALPPRPTFLVRLDRMGPWWRAPLTIWRLARLYAAMLPAIRFLRPEEEDPRTTYQVVKDREGK
jgi:hypothetical protein